MYRLSAHFALCVPRQHLFACVSFNFFSSSLCVCSYSLFTMPLSICMVDKRFYMHNYIRFVVFYSRSLCRCLCLVAPPLQYAKSLRASVYLWFFFLWSCFNIFILHRLCLSCLSRWLVVVRLIMQPHALNTNKVKKTCVIEAIPHYDFCAAHTLTLSSRNNRIEAFAH